jgi:hypothetical protein
VLAWQWFDPSTMRKGKASFYINCMTFFSDIMQYWVENGGQDAVTPRLMGGQIGGGGLSTRQFHDIYRALWPGNSTSRNSL